MLLNYSHALCLAASLSLFFIYLFTSLPIYVIYYLSVVNIWKENIVGSLQKKLKERFQYGYNLVLTYICQYKEACNAGGGVQERITFPSRDGEKLLQEKNIVVLYE